MGIRDNFKKRTDSNEGKTLLQVRIPDDLLMLVDAQIDRDLKHGLDVDRTVVVIECLKNYLKESGKVYRPKKAV
jgi:hypothetical protein